MYTVLYSMGLEAFILNRVPACTIEWNLKLWIFYLTRKITFCKNSPRIWRIFANCNILVTHRCPGQRNGNFVHIYIYPIVFNLSVCIHISSLNYFKNGKFRAVDGIVLYSQCWVVIKKQFAFQGSMKLETSLTKTVLRQSGIVLYDEKKTKFPNSEKTFTDDNFFNFSSNCRTGSRYNFEGKMFEQSLQVNYSKRGLTYCNNLWIRPSMD